MEQKLKTADLFLAFCLHLILLQHTQLSTCRMFIKPMLLILNLASKPSTLLIEQLLMQIYHLWHLVYCSGMKTEVTESSFGISQRYCIHTWTRRRSLSSLIKTRDQGVQLHAFFLGRRISTVCGIGATTSSRLSSIVHNCFKHL